MTHDNRDPKLDKVEARQGDRRRMNSMVLYVSLGIAIILALVAFITFSSAT